MYVFEDEDFTPLSTATMETPKAHPRVKNTTMDGKIMVWLKDEPDRPLYTEIPRGLAETGVSGPDWKRF